MCPASTRASVAAVRQGVGVEVVELGVFARAWAVQRRRVAWLLGAGASAAAGVPTAAQIIDDLLLRLYADAFGLVRQALDPADPATAARIRAHYDGANGIPPAGSVDEYSAVFAAAMPDASARRNYLRGLLRGKRPCFGQRVLGAATVAGAVDLVLTTNFDELIETAVADARAASAAPVPLLSIAALDSAERAAAAVADNEWPLLVKLHGDFREMPLKNLDQELQTQDATLRRAVIDSSRSFGLAVSGYSGRDASVMGMLREAAAQPGAWPAGLWWLAGDPDRLPTQVVDLLNVTAGGGVATRVVRAQNFDETMAALAAQVQLEPGIRAYVDGLRPRAVVSDAPLPAGPARAFPVLRLNALPVLDAPRRAWRLPAPAGMTAADMRERLTAGGWRGAAVLGPDEILALGSAGDLVRCLDAVDQPTGVDIDPLAGNARAHITGLVGEALVRGLARRLPVRPIIRDRGSGNRLVVVSGGGDESDHNRCIRDRFAAAYGGPLTGTLPPRLGTSPDGNSRSYAEGVRMRLERAVETVWLVFVPFTWTEATAEMAAAARAGAPRPVDPAGDWNRERWAQRRRNETWAVILAAWADSLAPDRPTTRIHALSRRTADQQDATGGAFALGAVTAYSRQAL